MVESCELSWAGTLYVGVALQCPIALRLKKHVWMAPACVQRRRQGVPRKHWCDTPTCPGGVMPFTNSTMLLGFGRMPSRLMGWYFSFLCTRSLMAARAAPSASAFAA